jgi:ABC-type proline/glycine betaine transport system permease subunit
MFIYAGAFAKGDSVALQTVPGYTTEAACISQGTLGKMFVAGTSKEYVFKCIKVN